jgi:hypothetical protein
MSMGGGGCGQVKPMDSGSASTGAIEGEQASEEALSTMAAQVGLPDFQQWKSDNMETFAEDIGPNASAQDVDKAMMGAYEAAIANEAFPGLENMSNEERNQLVGDWIKAAESGDETALAQAVQALGGSNDLSLDDYQELGLSLAGNHDAGGEQDDYIHKVVEGSQSGGASDNNELFTLNHLGHMGANGLAGQGAGEDAGQNGIDVALKNL